MIKLYLPEKKTDKGDLLQISNILVGGESRDDDITYLQKKVRQRRRAENFLDIPWSTLSD